MSLHLACLPARRALIAAALLAALPMAALAQPASAPAPATAAPVAEPPGYREAIDEAIAEYSAGRYPEARALFLRAHGLQPSARTLRGLGMTEFELRNYTDAARLLQDALSSTDRPLEGDLRAATEALLARARGFIGRFTLALSPPELQLSVDGAPARRDSDGGLSLAIGDHALRAEAQGYVPVSHTLRVNGGESLALNITLEKDTLAAAPVAAPTAAQPAQPAAPAVTPTSSAQPRDEESGSVFSSPWFWTVAAVVVIGAGVGVSLVLLSEEAGVEPTHGGSTGAVVVAP